jgi:glutathione synthase/RimK-type ligase-like ATP-grasp enzyme
MVFRVLPMPYRSHIGVVTCIAAKLRDYFPTAAEPDFLPTEPPFTPDDQLLVEELRRHGHEVRSVIWGCDVAALVGSVDRLLIRSPWDYMDSLALRRRFMKWIAELDRAGLAVENHPRVMAWLTDKRYLKDLEAAGVPIVPTRVVAPGEAVRLAEVFTTDGPLIVKPSVSAAGAGLVYLTSAAEAEAFQAEFEVCGRQQWYLIQPFVPQIQTAGEWSLIYLGGSYSHAAHKLPGEGEILVHAEQGGSLRFADPPSAVRAAGDQVMAHFAEAFARGRDNTVPFPPLYLRIDVIESASGPLLSECEGVEPELFFRACPGSEQRFRQLLEQRMGI